MDATWPKALAWVRQDEGGNDDDPADSGGRTSRGITQREYTAYCKLHHISANADVWKAPDPIVDMIYDDEYWKPYCPSLPAGVDYLFFDFNVNAGPHRAIITLQQAVNVDADGRVGPITRLAVINADRIQLITRYTAAKKNFYTRLAQAVPKDRKFLAGWLSRADRVEVRAKSLIPPAQGPDNGQPVTA